MSFVACGSKVDDLDDGALQVFQENVLGLEIAMYQTRFVQESQAVQELLGENPDQCGTKTPELVLLDQFVQVDAKELKDQAQVLPVYESVLESQKMMVVVFVKLSIELVAISMILRRADRGRLTKSRTDTSIILWLKYAVRFLMTLTATTSWVFRF